MSEQPGSATNQVQAHPFAGVQQRSFIRAEELGVQDPVRSSVPLGTIDAGAIADIDPAGLVQMRGVPWSVDWWIGAADKWHFPSRDATVVQSLVGSTPVVQTVMHVPGGEIIHRAYTARAGSDGAPDSQQRWEDSAVVIEVENATKTPVALAFAFVPLQLFGPGQINELSVAGATVSVDGEVAGVFSRTVARRVVGAPGTTAIRLPMTDDEDPEGTWSVPGQLAEGAYVVPLTHTGVVRLLLPRIDTTTADSASRWGGQLRLARSGARPASRPAPGGSWQAPTSEQVSAGWAVHTRDAASVTTPEPLLASLLKVAEGHLLVASTDAFLDGDGVIPIALRNAALVESLVSAGIDEPLGPIARALVDAERMGGSIRMPDRSDAVVALVHAAAPLLTGSRSDAWAEDLIGPVAKGIHRIGQGKGTAVSFAGSGPFEESLGEWALTRSAAVALARVAPSMRAVDQPEVAESAEKIAAELWVRSGELLSRITPDPSGSGSVGRNSLLMKALALRASLMGGADSGVDHLISFARLGTLGVLGDAADMRGVPTGALATDPAATATRVAALLDLLCGQGPAGPVILPSWSPYWFDKPVEVNRVRTAWGLVSYALRWHGGRPTILWEVDRAAGAPPEAVPVLTAPGLDAAWSATGWSGEALLSPVTVSPEVLAEIAHRDTPKLAVQLGMKKKSKG